MEPVYPLHFDTQPSLKHYPNTHTHTEADAQQQVSVCPDVSNQTLIRHLNE